MNIEVRSGDSLWYYSQIFMIPLNLIIDSNPHLDPNILTARQKVIIPGFTISKYEMKLGDTLWKLAYSRNLSIDVLLLLNQQVNPSKIVVGTIVYLPCRVTQQIVTHKKKYDYKTLTSDINSLQEFYPFIKVESIGKSVLGNSLYVIKFGRGSKKVQINASFHANEWITCAILMKLVNDYLLALTNLQPIRGIMTLPIYETVQLTIIPMVNPDGVDLVLNGPPLGMEQEILYINRGSVDFSGWKANINGVDLNKQFPAKWEIDKARSREQFPAPRDFPGEAPLTEPEAVSMKNVAEMLDFDRMLAFHTQGKEFYWGYEGSEPQESKILANEFEYVSGYKAVQYIDSNAGYKDWFIQEFKKPGFTIELGKGINPLPLSQFDQIYEEIVGIFLAALYM